MRVPGSKSFTNRALVAAALARGESLLLNPLDADDTRTLAAALVRLGARVAFQSDSWSVVGPLAPPREEITIDVGPAGTPARFLLALLSALPGRFVLDGSLRMRERPMGALVDALRGLGAVIVPLSREGFLPLRIEGGRLRNGRVSIRGDVSSQFLSALMLVGTLVPGGIQIDVVGELASAAYVTLTRQVIEAFEKGATRYAVPGDDSAACFFLAGAVVAKGRVVLGGLEERSAQPDAVFRDWARAAGANVAFEEGSVVVEGGAVVRPLEIDVNPAPDAALPLAAMLAFADGTSRVSGVERLREKESDRLAAAVDLLSRGGAVAREEADAGGRPVLVVDGRAGRPRRADFFAHGDHRVAMSAAVLALALPDRSTLDEPGAVSKSYPRFFEEWSRLVR